ncbi:hypothetical protein KI387_006278, partial [Taxus chinensis]
TQHPIHALLFVVSLNWTPVPMPALEHSALISTMFPTGMRFASADVKMNVLSSALRGFQKRPGNTWVRAGNSTE